MEFFGSEPPVSGRSPGPHLDVEAPQQRALDEDRAPQEKQLPSVQVCQTCVTGNCHHLKVSRITEK